MLKSVSKTVTFLIGVLAMFVGGILFIIMSDLTFKNNSGNLILVVLLCFGSAIAFFFSNNFVEKPVIMYLLKGIGLALTIGMIVYYHIFSGSEFYISAVDKLRRYGAEKATEYAFAKASVVIALVFSYLALAGQAANTVLVAVLKEDDEVKPSKEQEDTTVVAEEANDVADEAKE